MTDRPTHITADGALVPLTDDEFAQWQADNTANAAAPATAPDGPTLGDWRVALSLWPSTSGTGDRLDDVEAAVAALKADSDPQKQVLGKIADQRIAYSNNVYRAELLLFNTAVGFTTADVDESLWRAGQVAKGDLSGVWPLPASQ